MARRDEYGYTRATLDIGDWDMDATVSLSVAHGLSSTEWKTVRDIQITIRNDAETQYYMLSESSNDTADSVMGGIQSWNSVNFNLIRRTGLAFDSTSFDSTSYNRGFITYYYIAD